MTLDNNIHRHKTSVEKTPDNITLHQAIQRLLDEYGYPMTIRQITNELNTKGLYQKPDGSEIKSSQVHARIRKHPDLFLVDKLSDGDIMAALKSEDSSQQSESQQAILSQQDFQKAARIKEAVSEYFAHNHQLQIQANELMDFFINKGIFDKDHKNGLPIRHFLRHLDKADALSLIPQAYFEQKPVNKNWFFVNVYSSKTSNNISMTLHEAIVKLLLETGKSMTTQDIADELNKNGWYKKKDGSRIDAFQIHGRTRNYAHLFQRQGSLVSLSVSSDTSQKKDASIKHTKYTNKPTVKYNKVKDEHYVLDLCDKVLGIKSIRQYKFDFLLGDAGTKLPVDSFYPTLNLVIEYRERQHTEKVDFFDKPDKMTVSGVHRGEQRKIYDERRREVLPKHGIELVEISFENFSHDKQKRIIRNPDNDENTIREILKRHVEQ